MLPKPKKSRKVLPQKASRTIEKKYRAIIANISNSLKKDIREQLIPLLKREKSQYQDSLSDDIDSILLGLKIKYSNIVNLSKPLISGIVKSLNSVQKQKFVSNINSAIGIDIGNMLKNENIDETVKSLTNKNISLIKSIPDEFFKQIEMEIYNGITNGERFETIAKKISGIKGVNSVFGKLDKRVKFIARNEIENINAVLVKKRSEKVGIKKFMWKTSRDERVRNDHAELDGKIFTWEDGAVVNGKNIIPGSDFNCRCVAINIIDGINYEE